MSTTIDPQLDPHPLAITLVRAGSCSCGGSTLRSSTGANNWSVTVTMGGVNEKSIGHRVSSRERSADTVSSPVSACVVRPAGVLANPQDDFRITLNVTFSCYVIAETK